MIDQPDKVLPNLVRLAMETCDAQSAGISLFESSPPSAGIFRWHHLVGQFAKFAGGTTPRDFSPCGVVPDRLEPVFMRRPEHAYPYLAMEGLPLREVLLVPMYVSGSAPAGTLWVVTHDENRHFDSEDARVTGELAAFAGLVLRVIDGATVLHATEDRLRNALDQQELLTQEMSHRVKNLLAITSAIVSMSGRSAETPRDMTDSVLGRLSALSNAHALIQRDGKGIDAGRVGTLQDIVATILRPYDDTKSTTAVPRSSATGPVVRVGERALTSLALVFHEMATNAAKYGALSRAEGGVRVTWRIEGGKLLLAWDEYGGPKVARGPSTEGFGSLLARRSITGELQGELQYDWRPEGLLAVLAIPTERLSQ